MLREEREEGGEEGFCGEESGEGGVVVVVVALVGLGLGWGVKDVAWEYGGVFVYGVADGDKGEGGGGPGDTGFDGRAGDRPCEPP